jgi:hypothetical protein
VPSRGERWPGPAQRRFEPVGEHETVGQIGQGVVVQEVANLGLGAAAPADLLGHLLVGTDELGVQRLELTGAQGHAGLELLPGLAQRMDQRLVLEVETGTGELGAVAVPPEQADADGIAQGEERHGTRLWPRVEVQVQGERQQGRQQEGGEGGRVRRQGGDGPGGHAGDHEGDEDVEDARIDVDEEPSRGAPGDAGEQRADRQSAGQCCLLARLEATGAPVAGPGQPQPLRRQAEGQPGSNQGGRRVGDREEGEDDGDGGIDDGEGRLLAQQLAEQNGPWPRATAGRRDRGG